MMCQKCGLMSGIIVLVVGVLFLLTNLTSWTFWGIQWYTAAFILIGISMLGSGCCGGCNACCSMPEKKPMKKK